VIAAKAAAKPGVELLEAGADLTAVKVLPPPKQVVTKFLDDLADAPTTGAPRDLPDLFFESLLCRSTDKEPEAAAAEAKAEELSLPWPSDSALGFIYFELELGGEVAGDTLQHSLACSQALHVNVAIIGISGESVAPSLKLPVQFVQKQITESKGERGPPWGVPSTVSCRQS
jgi:hypothetical protein